MLGRENPVSGFVHFVELGKPQTDRVTVMASDKSWNLKMVHAREAFAKLPRRPDTDDEINWGGVEIAHLDTGYTRHSVFGPWNGNNSDTLLADHGMNYVDSGDLPEDTLSYSGFPGHGTRTASVLCANLPGTLIGVAPGLPTIPYRVTNNVVITSKSTRKKIAAAIRHAVETNSCEVISISLGTPILSLFGTRQLGEAVDFAYERGVMVVAAGGQVIDRVTYPGRFFRSIGVGGVKPNREVWFEYLSDEDESETEFIDVWGPADEIWRANSVLKDGRTDEAPYEEGDGTSYATVHVAAAAAIWLAFHGDELDAAYPEPWQRIEAFRSLIKSTSQEVAGAYRPHPGTGILNIEAVLDADLPAAADLIKEERPASGQVM
jgi:subtilisin family serine protease